MSLDISFAHFSKQRGTVLAAYLKRSSLTKTLAKRELRSLFFFKLNIYLSHF